MASGQPQSASTAPAENNPTMSTSEANTNIANDPVPSEAIAAAPADGTTAEANDQPAAIDGVAATGENSGETVVAPDVNGSAGTPASNKRSHKKKGGVPEHKAKKVKGKKSTAELQLDCQPGDYYWAQMRGFPKWPSIICDEAILPESLLVSRPVSALRPDGSFREDYRVGGKAVRDRTYPIMYLHTNEFSWTPNTDLKPLDVSQLEITATVQKNKKLVAAYELAKEQPKLDHFKHIIATHLEETAELERQIIAEEAEQTAAAEKKQKKKDEKEKRKSLTKTPKPKKAADPEEMEVDSDAEVEPVTKSSKKRKADATDGEKSAKKAKTGSTTKLSLKQNTTPASSSKTKATKPKAKTPAADADAGLTEAEIRQKLEKETLWFRHKLQKTFLTAGDTPPTGEEVEQASDYLAKLERHERLDDAIIRTTKIHKVLRGILTAKYTIARDDELRISERCRLTLDRWGYPFEAPKTSGGGSSSKDGKAATNGETADEHTDKKNGAADAGAADTEMADAPATGDKPAEDAPAKPEEGTTAKINGDTEMKDVDTAVDESANAKVTNGDAVPEPATATAAS